MNPQISFKPYEAFKEIAATAPAAWARNEVAVPGHSYCVMLCDEADVRMLKVNGNRKRLEDRIGAPVIPVLGDSVRQPENIVELLGGAPVVTLDVPVSGAMWSFWPAYPAPYQEGPDLDRSGAVFAGRTDYPERVKLLPVLEKMGVRVVCRDNEGRTYADYVRDLRSARIVVNFCKDRKTGLPQMKARVVEALLAGAVLLEQANPLTRTWLTPGVEYLEWSSLEQLRELIVQVEDRPLRSAEMAQRGQTAARARLNPQIFWGKVQELAAC